MNARTMRRTAFAFAAILLAPTAHAVNPADEPRLREELAGAEGSLAEVCREAWQYDNLRPAMARVVWMQATIAGCPPGPVVHLSQGSPQYRFLVGQMGYWGAFCHLRKQRLVDFAAAPKKGSEGKDPTPLERAIMGAQRQHDLAWASYMRACAWAWPYSNMRSLCKLPGFDPATFLNPLLPNPTVNLSAASPNYKTIVAELKLWGPQIPKAQHRLQDLLDDQKSAEEAADALAGKPRPVAPSPDSRLGQMAAILDKIKPACQRWHAVQAQLDALLGPWQLAHEGAFVFGFRKQQIESEIATLLAQANDSGVGPRLRELQRQLPAVNLQLAQAQAALMQVENSVAALRDQQKQSAAQGYYAIEPWAHRCDVLGRWGPAAHRQALPLLNQWIADEPALWQPYLARAVARLHTGEAQQSLADLQRVADKLQGQGVDAESMAYFAALHAYALSKTDPKAAEVLFSQLGKGGRKSWFTFYFHGWASLEQAKYTAARNDFRSADGLCKSARAEPLEALGLLLAACPTDDLRDAPKALEDAKQACRLTQLADWICLDTVAIAFASTADYASATQWATKALALAPAESQALVRMRLALYEKKQPFRMK